VPLTLANVAFVAAVALHAADHVRQGRALAPAVLAGGTALIVLAIASLALTLRGHRSAPLAATLVGLIAAVGVTSSHLAPYWGPLSDPYADQSLDRWSWAAVLAEIATALLFAAAGAATLRGRATHAASGAAPRRAAG
jgi:hypothetical protein